MAQFLSDMSKLSKLEYVIYNRGERLLPGITHSAAEIVRHRSSYQFFHDAIRADLEHAGALGRRSVRILDLGFGTGHGCEVLSRIPGSSVVGIDNSRACLRYARRYHGAPNISYVIADIPAYLRRMKPFDYVVSRGVIEHVPNGLDETIQARWTQRLMFDVPYDEPAGVNEHHVVSNVTAESFSKYKDLEIFYEEVGGAIYNGPPRPEKPNMIMAVCSAAGLPPLGALLDLPRPPWRMEGPEKDMAPKPTALHRLIDRLWVPSK
jgi:SAM-dependent methyltransferase